MNLLYSRSFLLRQVFECSPDDFSFTVMIAANIYEWFHWTIWIVTTSAESFLFHNKTTVFFWGWNRSGSFASFLKAPFWWVRLEERRQKVKIELDMLFLHHFQMKSFFNWNKFKVIVQSVQFFVDRQFTAHIHDLWLIHFVHYNKILRRS